MRLKKRRVVSNSSQVSDVIFIWTGLVPGLGMKRTMVSPVSSSGLLLYRMIWN
jgi:hypothetical protein